MHAIVFASRFIREIYQDTHPSPRDEEPLYVAAEERKRDAARAGAAVGAMVLYAGLISLAGR